MKNCEKYIFIVKKSVLFIYLYKENYLEKNKIIK